MKSIHVVTSTSGSRLVALQCLALTNQQLAQIKGGGDGDGGNYIGVVDLVDG